MTIQTLFGTDEGERGENRRDHKGSPLIYEDPYIYRGHTHTYKQATRQIEYKKDEKTA